MELIVFKPNCSIFVVDQVIRSIRQFNVEVEQSSAANLEINLQNGKIWLINFNTALAEKLREHPAISHVGGVHFRQRNTQIRRLNNTQ